MRLRYMVLAAVAGILAAGTAPAATFNLAGSLSPTSAGFSLTVDGITATITGKYFNGGVTWNTTTGIISSATVVDSKVGRYAQGAGVSSGKHDEHTVDGYGPNDFIQIVFSETVTLKSIGFGYFSSDPKYDYFRWLADASGNGAIGNGDWMSASTKAASSVTPTGSYVTGKVFGFAAFGDKDSWKLWTVNVDRLPPPPPIPLPAAGVLMLAGLGGLGGLGLWRARRRPD